MLNYVKTVQSIFEEHGDNDRAVKMSAYMKNKFPFFGIASPVRKQITKEVHLALRQEEDLDLHSLIELFWSKPEREYHYFAMEAAQKCHKKWNENSIAHFEEMTTKKSWWDTVDFIATNLVGAYLLKNPDETQKMDQWNEDSNLWKNRVSILFQLKYKNNTDWERLTKYILQHASSTEFFHRKAIGWALREYAKHHPEQVLPFVENNDLSNLSKREALKHF